MMSSISLLMLAGGTSSSALRWIEDAARVRIHQDCLRRLDDDLAALRMQWARAGEQASEGDKQGDARAQESL